MKTKINSLIILAFGLILFSCKKENNSPVDSRIKDIDGNVYDTVVIGTQVWMVQNLKTTHYNDGSAIPTGLSDIDWSSTTDGAYAIYDNNAVNDTIYGKLYNWYAVNTGKLAPAGWHVPSDSELITLTTYLGGLYIAGGALKATTLWSSPNTGATNSSGFTALPAGTRFNNGSFTTMGEDCAFWSSTEFDSNDAYFHSLSFAQPSISRFTYGSKISGFSIRCVRD